MIEWEIGPGRSLVSKPAVLCQGPRGHRYLLAIDAITRVTAANEPNIIMITMTYTSAPYRVIGAAEEFLALLPPDHQARLSLAEREKSRSLA